MSISEFKVKLSKSSINCGGKFVKTDFHVHYPGPGDDYEYRGTDAADLLAEALTNNEISLAVILRHQAFPSNDELAKLQAKCPKTHLIPGMEINVFVDTLDKKVDKDHYFHCIVAADPATQWGYLLAKAKENLHYEGGQEYPSGFHSSIQDVAKFFTDNGALFIPAHLHQGKPPQTSRSIDDIYGDGAFLSFVAAGKFSALEVRDSATAVFFDGNHSTQSGKAIPQAVCIQSSDAHHHNHVIDRQRFTWLQMERPTFSELKAALAFPHRVRIGSPAATHSRVIGLHVAGQFIADEWIEFNSGMNCLIGCKGSGKTSILECLRFVLNTDIPKERLDSVSKHIQHILGPSGFVECLVTRADGSELLLTRRSDSPSRIKVLDIHGNARETESLGRADFDAAILGWHEIEAIADHASARIRLVDRLEGEEEIRTKYVEIEAKIESARDLLPSLQRKIKRLDTTLRNLWTLQNKRKTLKKLEQGALLDLQTDYEKFLACEQELKTLRQQVQSKGEEIRRNTDSAYSFQLRSELSADPRLEAILRAHAASTKCIAELQEKLSSGMTELQGVEDSAIARIDTEILSTQKAFAQFRETEYEPRVNQLAPDERQILSSQIQIIEETKDLPELEVKCNQLKAEVQSLSAQMHQFCNDICSDRERICEIRLANIQKINGELPNVKLGFRRSENKALRNSFQESFKEEASSFFGFVDRYASAGSESYQRLRALFADLQSIELGEESWRKVDKLFWDAKFIDFLRVVDDDDVELSMQVGRAGFVPIQNLSAGQRCTAVFPLLLRNARGPLVIDQPEDNLDNRYIADVIAPDLLKKKRQQQFIATSHNANLVVLTDADLILHADSDGRSGKMVNRGFFSCSGSPIMQSVIDVLDGGETAMLARQKKYGTKY